ncbi:putative pol-like protein, partial [Operophtera brumata]
MIIICDGQATTIGSLTWRPNALDLSLVSPSLALHCEWSVHDSPLGTSYYLPVICIISLDSSCLNKKHLPIYPIGIHTYSHFCDILRTATVKSVPNLNNSSCSTISHQSCPKNPKIKRLRALKKLTIKIERQNSWVLLCETFNRCTPLSVIWKLMRKFNKTYTPNNNEDDTWILDFLMKYTPDFVINTPNAVDTTIVFLLNPFSINELNSAIFSRRDTAFGLDGIPYILFKKLSSNRLEFFLKVLNLLWDNNDIPPDWKIDCLVPILKPKKPKLSPDSYRPITLTSCLFFFDIAGAFNSVNIEVLCRELLTIGIPGKIINWIQTFLNNREVFVKYNRHLYGPRLSSVGVCQGGILSPLIFILYIRRLNLILSSHVKKLQFADDLVVYASGTDLAQVAEIVNDALAKLNKYFSYLDLNVNPSKTKVVVFGKRYNNMPIIYYNNSPLPVSLEVKFLGILFSNNLSWNNYTKHIFNKANKAYNILKSLAGSYWGADPKILLTLYKSLVRSHFEYGFYCFASDVKIVNKIDVFQNKCLRLITGAFRSTPINSMQIECNLPPIIIRFNYLRERFILKLYSVYGNSLLVNLASAQPVLKPFFMLQDFQSFFYSLQNLNIYQSSHILPCYEGSFISKFPAMKIIINNNLSTKEEVYVMLSLWIDHKFIYTDGSKNDNAVSFAIFEPSLKIGVGHKIDKHASIFTAEAVAILSALKHIRNRNLGHKKWVV